MSFLQKYGRYIPMIGIAIALISVGYMFFFANSSLNIFSSDWVETEAEVVLIENSWDYSIDESVDRATVKFEAEDGETYEVRMNGDVGFFNSIKKEITIKYDKNNPHTAELASNSTYIYIIVIGIILLIIAFRIPFLKKHLVRLLNKI